MRKRRRAYPVMRETDLFKFGRYKGRPLWRVLAEDPAYVAWLLNNLEGFRLEATVREHLHAMRRAGL